MEASAGPGVEEENDPLAGLEGYPGAARTGRLDPGQSARAVALSHHLPPALFAVVTAWVAYLYLVPILWERVGPAVLVAVPTVGLFLFSWLGYYRHELWHNYFPGINNRRWYTLVSWLLGTDPQVYRAAHASHHKFVHTPADIEFFCENWLTDRKKRRRQFFFELILGQIAWEAATFWRLRKEGRATWRGAFLAVGARVGLGCAWLAVLGLVSPDLGGYALTAWGATAWLGAVVTRHNQWIEHLGIISEGDIIERNALTRNLAPASLPARIFNLYNHADPEEHIYHHTDGRVATRNLGFPLPSGATTITLKGYFKVLRGYARSL